MIDHPLLECRLASEEDRLQAYRNVFEMWPHGKTMDEHLQRRLASVQHNRAAWFVGSLGNSVAVSLACYPLEFRLRNQVVKGIAIGAVHTVLECRGRGYAPQLFQFVEQYQSAKGCEISLLFSDIAPGYYARMGYVECPAFEAWIDVDPSRTAPRSEFDLIAFEPGKKVELLNTVYEQFHRELAIWTDRSHSYWSYLFNKCAGGSYYWLKDSHNEKPGYVFPPGYVALAIRKSRMHVEDFACARNDQTQLLAAVLDLAAKSDCRQVGGWLPSQFCGDGAMSERPRQKEITMLKPLNPQRKIDPEVQLAASYIHEIDHV